LDRLLIAEIVGQRSRGGSDDYLMRGVELAAIDRLQSGHHHQPFALGN
jgi:hypothetical protein